MAVSDQCRGSLLKRSNSFQTQEDSGVLRQLFMWDDVSNKCYRTSCHYGKINYIKKNPICVSQTLDPLGPINYCVCPGYFDFDQGVVAGRNFELSLLRGCVL